MQGTQEKKYVKSHTILYADDESVNLKIFYHAFKRDYNVFTALNGFDAFDIMEKNKVDLIVRVQQMTFMSGVDLLTEVVFSYPDIVRMIMVSFTAIQEIRNVVNKFEPDTYLSMPWDRDQLEWEFDKALGKKKRNQIARIDRNHGIKVKEKGSHWQCLLIHFDPFRFKEIYKN